MVGEGVQYWPVCRSGEEAGLGLLLPILRGSKSKSTPMAIHSMSRAAAMILRFHSEMADRTAVVIFTNGSGMGGHK